MTKILDWSKLKEIAEDISKFVYHFKSKHHMLEKTLWEKKKLLVTMSSFSTKFSSIYHLKAVKSRDCVGKG